MDRTTQFFEKTVDLIYRWLPRPEVTASEWHSCRLVAHRGCHDMGQSVHENTIAAFEAACQHGIWGIEFDVQWTLDQVPVVIHDLDTARLPGTTPVEIGRTDFDELRRFCPLVPRLDEVIERYAGRTHLMIELKGETINSRAIQQLKSCLASLEPVRDFHIMSLQPEDLRTVHEFPVEALLLIAITNTREMYQEAIKGDFGGLTGHFLLLNGKMRAELKSRNLPWGTGFVNSVNLLAREIRSGSSWIFSDAADHIAMAMNQPR